MRKIQITNQTFTKPEGYAWDSLILCVLCGLPEFHFEES